jgi:hypothetical protein
MVTMTKTLLESGVLGAVTGKRVWNARLIASGVSLTGKYYSGEMLERLDFNMQMGMQDLHSLGNHIPSICNLLSFIFLKYSNWGAVS